MTTTTTPTTPANTDGIVRGKAVYLEFINGGVTTQVLIMPEGNSSSHRLVPMTVYRRRISALQPRKTWRTQTAHYKVVDLKAHGITDSNEIIEKTLGFMLPLLRTLRTNGYTLYRTPIVVDATAEDLEHVRQSKTPYKALGRVWKTRKALGWPETYYHSPA